MKVQKLPGLSNYAKKSSSNFRETIPLKHTFITFGTKAQRPSLILLIIAFLYSISAGEPNFCFLPYRRFLSLYTILE
jgi:hypothetical protein